LPVEYLRVRNFKLIEDALMKFSRINLLIGPNASGKSTILHAINAIKTSTDLLKNSELSLGGEGAYHYRDLVYLHDPLRWIELEVGGFITLVQGLDLCYEIKVKVSSDKGGRSRLKLHVNERALHELIDEDLKMLYSPSALGAGEGLKLGDFSVRIRGGTVYEPYIEVRGKGEALLYEGRFTDLLDEGLLFCPALRGEVKYEIYQYGDPIKERVLKIVVEKPELKESWNKLLSEALDYSSKVDISRISSSNPPRIGLSNLATNSNVALEPFSLAQLLYVMPLVLAARPSSTIMIEEPEIHLHPRAQAKLIECLAREAKNRDLQLILTTHSEHVLFRLLTLVREGFLRPEELKVYYFERKEIMPPKISIEELRVDEKGELDKGLKGFFEADLDELSRFAKAKSSS
jgi:energy-coupling factor transporter ATP-binding protein EcfA2